MMARGFISLIASKLTEKGCISQYTRCSRTPRAMSCVYWDPKSRTRTSSRAIMAVELARAAKRRKRCGGSASQAVRGCVLVVIHYKHLERRSIRFHSDFDRLRPRRVPSSRLKRNAGSTRRRCNDLLGARERACRALQELRWEH